jgi:hypothetical protein
MTDRHRVADTRHSAECGTPIVVTTAGRVPKRYCSSRCQGRAYYRTHRAAIADKARALRARRQETAEVSTTAD